jgi:hypothetical protein
MRARSLKPGYFKNEQLSALTPLIRLLFSGLWCLADRKGRLRDNPRLIGAELFPYEHHNIERLLATLAGAKEPNGGGAAFILRYEANSVRYIQIVNFDSHQNPHMKEPPSTIPAPGSAPGSAPDKDSAEHRKKPMPSRADSGLRIRTPDTDSGLSGAEHQAGNGRDPLSPEAPEPVRSAARKALALIAWDEEASDRLRTGEQDLPPRPPPFEPASAYGPDSRNDERERLLLWEGGDDEAFTRHVFEMGPTP